MKNKLFGSGLSLVLFLSLFAGAGLASAQTASFPSGCSSGLGYSITTGLPCNGTSTATIGPMPGCTTALGYSVTTGRPCSGGPTAIFWLSGCTSTQGFSSIDGKACNGTTVADPVVPALVITTPTPGLPTTGAGGNASSNALLLIASGLVATLGLAYLVRPTSKVS